MEENDLKRILDGSMKPTDVPFEILRSITDNFSTNRIIGEGGFGIVYKGVLQDGTVVAVKRIVRSKTIDEKLFRREVDSLMEVDHQNIVKFLGFCSHTVHKTVKNTECHGYIYAEERERLMCFEYISNGSLAKHITDELRGLEWDARYEIIKGICRGVYYLHMEKRIIHMDLKPGNILMDNQMVPKIADFGLSRPTEKSQTTSENHFSTPGYGAPENQFGSGRMSVKSDIYSLGVIIIQLVTGRKGRPEDTSNILRRWRHRWSKSATGTPPAYQQQVIKCIKIGIMFQTMDPYKRPFISDIMNDIGEMENLNNDIMDPDDPTIGQINYVDDMLGVEPLELRFANYVNKNNQISSSCLIELNNNTDGFIAFSIQTTSPLTYRIDPNNNIVRPHSKLRVDITFPEATQDRDNALLQYNANQHSEQFIVRSIKVSEGLAAEDINQDMFDKGKDVDEVDLAVVSEAKLPEVPCKKVITPSQADYSKGLPLVVHPLELRFPFESNKLIPCPLHLTNNTDEPVIFRLVTKNVEYTSYLLFWKKKTGYLKMLPLHGVIPPRSTYTLVLTSQEMEKLPRETHIDVILQSSVADEYLKPFTNDDECNFFFEKVKETRDTLNEVTLQAICAPAGETANKIIPMMKNSITWFFDAHPTKPWIIMGHIWNQAKIWNYESQKFVVSRKESGAGSVYITKVIARKQWVLAADTLGYLHVYDYGTEVQKHITFFKPDLLDVIVISLAIHPTKPYVLTSGASHIRLLDWDNNWRIIKEFRGHSGSVLYLSFHPINHDSFASASDDCTIKVWNIDSPKASYTLSGHSKKVMCLDFFTRDHQLYLISCSYDQTAKVWDMEEKTCVHTIEAFTSPVTCVISLSNCPYLLTASKDGLVHLWSTSDFSLARIFDVSPRVSRDFLSLTCLDAGKRFAVQHSCRITILDVEVASKKDNWKLVIEIYF